MFKLPVQIKEQISGYETAIKEFIDGRMSWARFAGVRVPWGNYSHRGGKIFMSRVRVPAGILSAEQLKALAYCSLNYGNGKLHITTRQDIQIHEVTAENIIKIHEYLKDYELSSRGGGGNTIRNITCCPLAGVCAAEGFDVHEDAVALTEYLLADETSYNMPRKLKIAFSGCGIDCAACRVNDVGLAALNKDGLSGYRIYAGGGMGAKPAVGLILEEFIPRQDLGFAVTAIKNVFYKHGDRKNKHHNRLRFLIENIGFERFGEYYKKELRDLKNNEYISLREVHFSHPGPTQEGLPDLKDEDFSKFLSYNCKEQKQQGFMVVKLRIPRGDLDGKKALKLADLKAGFKEIEFRTSREQNMFICNVKKVDLYKLYAAMKNILDDFLYPETLLDIVACKGSVTCNLGLCNSPALSKEIEDMVSKNFLPAKIFNKLTVKINGCPNACGHHPVGIISLHGAARKVSGRAAPFYRLFLGGRTGFEETRLARDTGILIPAKTIPLFLKDFLNQIEREIREDADIDKYIEDRGEALAKEIAAKYSYVPPYTENRDFYIDWGKSEDFSLSGLGPGECGSGVLDMIQADLTDAKIALEKGEIEKALFLASRALLVVKGSDPGTGEEAIDGFIKKFVNEGIASDRYSNLKEVFISLNDNLSPEEKREKAFYAGEFLSHVNQLYKNMDPSFNFPKIKSAKPPRKGIASPSLDLKGTPCPINYVKAKLFMENLNPGDIAEILLDEGEPIKNVPASLKDDGYEILNIEMLDGCYKVTVRKAK